MWYGLCSGIQYIVCGMNYVVLIWYLFYSMDGLSVSDLCQVSDCAKIISVSGVDKKLLELKVN